MRNFNEGKYKEMRTYLANVDWNNLLKNKTATECWNCLKYEIKGIIETIFIKKTRETVQEVTPVKRGYKKNCSQTDALGVYKNTGNIEDYTNYKEALNLATTEIRKIQKNL